MPVPPNQSAFPELNLEMLSSKLPNQYRQWLRAGIVGVVLGYGLTLALLMYEGRVERPFAVREPYVILIALLSGWLERRGHLRAAASLLLTSVWVELHITLFAEGIRSIGTSVFSAVVVGTAICLGRRTAVRVALTALLSVPLALTLGWHFGRSTQRAGDLAALAVLLVSILGTVTLLHLFMDAFSRVLVQSERNAGRARELIDDAPDVIIALSDRGSVEDANPAAEKLFETPRAELLGKSFEELPLDALDPAELGDDARGSGRMPREYLVRGTGRTLEGLFRSVTRADGTTGLLFWLRDTTQRKRAEQQAALLEEQLQHSQKLEALGRLAGGVAHDFNNLLTTVGGYADLIARHEDVRIRDVAAELSAIRERGKAVTRQLLAFARKETSEPQSVDLGETLEQMDRLLRRLVDERIELQIRTERDATVYIDPGQLQQLILNLVVNAKDAMPHGGKLSVACRVDEKQDRVTLAVDDTGVGMDVGTQRRIFEPFFTTKPRGQGTGLGLSLVHGIVESSGGRLDLQSELGQGSHFSVSWPRCRDAARRSSRALPPLPRSSGGGCLLVAEDDREGRTLLVSLLEAAGYDVISAENGRQALERFEALRDAGGSVDLLVSDVRMPEMGGPELAVRLRAVDPALPIVFVSGYYEPDLEMAPFDTGRDVLAKPYTSSELLSRIERALHRTGVAEPARPA
jgi:two-component system cell cycle sensor histidine kinase/response regulator CckA